MILEGKNLMIVAHPDDELLFGSEQLLSSKEKWTVLCLTAYHNSVRAEEIKKVSEGLFNFVGYNMPDVWNGGFNEIELKQNILNTLGNYGPFDNILTHNQYGEYGHTQHISCHYEVLKIAQSLKIPIYCFNTSDEILPFNILSRKIELFKHYKSQLDLNLFEWNNGLLKRYLVSEDIELINGARHA